MSPSAVYCRSCGKALTPEDQAKPGNIYCAGCAAEAAALPRRETPPAADSRPAALSSQGAASPALAFLLGLIPGVGAIYNAQYAKGLIHVVVFGLLISIMNSGAVSDMEAVFGLMIPAWIFYMAFEAYHTAQRRQRGEQVDEFSSLVPLRGAGFPVAPVLLIAAGVLFLLHNLEILRIGQLLRYWPVALIALGVYML